MDGIFATDVCECKLVVVFMEMMLFDCIDAKIDLIVYISGRPGGRPLRYCQYSMIRTKTFGVVYLKNRGKVLKGMGQAAREF